MLLCFAFFGLARAIEEKFGGDNLEDMKRNFNSYIDRINEL